MRCVSSCRREKGRQNGEEREDAKRPERLCQQIHSSDCGQSPHAGWLELSACIPSEQVGPKPFYITAHNRVAPKPRSTTPSASPPTKQSYRACNPLVSLIPSTQEVKSTHKVFSIEIGTQPKVAFALDASILCAKVSSLPRNKEGGNVHVLHGSRQAGNSLDSLGERCEQLLVLVLVQDVQKQLVVKRPCPENQSSAQLPKRIKRTCGSCETLVGSLGRRQRVDVQACDVANVDKRPVRSCGIGVGFGAGEVGVESSDGRVEGLGVGDLVDDGPEDEAAVRD